MSYDIGKIRKALREGRSRATINRALYHQSRIKFHTTKRVEYATVSPWLSEPLTQWLNMVENILPHDKFVTFKALFRYPVATNEITGTCFDKLARIFDGANPVFNYQFKTPEDRADWEQFRRRALNEPEVWATKGWEFFKTEINSVLVVDLEREQTTERPEPYFYWLPIRDVLAYKADPTTGEMRFIAFRNKKRIVVIDDSTYQVFDDPKTTGMIEEGQMPIFENAHDLGYCPARFFCNTPISLEDPDVKDSPLTKVLEKLDWFLFFAISKRQLDLMGAYPILSGYEQACDYHNDESGDTCDGGFLRDKQGRYRIDHAGLLMRCPKCGNKRTVGAGSFVEIPVPSRSDADDVSFVPDLRNPVQLLSVDKASLDYNVDEVVRLRSEIITAVVGQDVIITNRDAFNEQQVQANFEDMTSVLMRIKRGFELAQEWVDSTVCRLRYGANFISAQIFYGDQFYLKSTEELRAQYQSAKNAGASEAELDAMQRRILETEYRNNGAELQRMLILSELEPYRHLTRDEMQTMYDKGIISARDLRMKLNFANFVQRFEREQTNILEFGSAIPYADKIKAIQTELERYAEEMGISQ